MKLERLSTAERLKLLMLLSLFALLFGGAAWALYGPREFKLTTACWISASSRASARSANTS